MPRRRNTGSGGLFRRGRLWWMSWSANGKRHRQSTGTEDKAEARDVLAKKLAARAAGVRAAKGVPLSLRELVDLTIADYEANKHRSVDRAERSAGHLVRVFGELLGDKDKSPASGIDEAMVTAYIARRVTPREKGGEGAATATVNRELAHLRRSLRLAMQSHRLERRPDFSTLTEDNVRKGFLEREQLDSILPHLPEHLRPVVLTAYITGWRVKSEILTRERRHLDLAAGWLRLEPGEGKSKQGRMFPLIPELKEILEAQEKLTAEMEREQGRVIAPLFHRNGKAIRDFRVAWADACRAAGLPGRYLHDFRRSAVRNLERASVPRSAAMAMVGHKTASVYQRYAIVDEAMLTEAGEKLAKLPRKARR